MDEKELMFIVEQGEGQFIEFKENVDKSLSKEIVAFSNAQGGKIYLGITDKGVVKGINITNSLNSTIIDIAKNCDPPIKVNLNKYKNILIVDVEEGKNKPYSCSFGFYLRRGASSQKLLRDEILEFTISEGRKTFDEEINENFKYSEDFDETKLEGYLKEAKLTNNLDNESILINLGVAKKIDGTLKFNNAGVLFFAKEPSKFFLTSKVVCAEYQTNEKVNILDRKIYDEGILEDIKQAINFVKRRVKVEFEIKTARRKEIPQYPEQAYREVIVNAIMHRDYFDNSSDVLVEVYRNKLVVFNPGGLVKWLKPDEFGKVSKTRNPVIASLLSKTIFVEKMGTGIKRINDAMNSAKLPKPDFEFYERSFYVTLADKTYTKDTVKDTLKDTVKDTVKFSLSQKRIIDEIKAKPDITAEELSIILKINLRNTKKNIAKLKELGLIKRVGSDKTGYWVVVD